MAEPATTVDLTHPPAGAWYRQTEGGFIIGATTRSVAALVAAPATLLWSRSVARLFIAPLWKGEFSVVPTEIMIPYLLVSVALVLMCLMTIDGRVEVERNGADGKIFVGFRKIGWSRRFPWSEIEEIGSSQHGRSRVIVLDGARRIAFGSMLTPVRRDFLLQGLRQLRFG